MRPDTLRTVLDTLTARRERIEAWLLAQEQRGELPLYASVDIRDAGFKLSVVDTNLFPAGFNNLCEHGIAESVRAFREAIRLRIPTCRRILVIAETHTRNTWYLEHLRVLQDILTQAGFQVTVATFLEVPPADCAQVSAVELETAAGRTVTIHAIQRVLRELTAGGVFPCFVILNNDLSTGVPAVLQGASTPIYPSLQAGWHARMKSHHFGHARTLLEEFAALVDADPWLFSCQFDVVDGVSIHADADRARIADAAAQRLRRIQAKYDEHGIRERPFVFLKADQGTYGMGIMAVEDPQRIATLGRRDRNKLYMGKGSRVITRYLLQEGVPTAHRIGAQVAEICLYQIANRFVGGFYRAHEEKGARDNLNAAGMAFHRMCPHAHRSGGDATQPNEPLFSLYRILARIAGVAAQREIVQLETVGRGA